jgi:hypothetical protein
MVKLTKTLITVFFLLLKLDNEVVPVSLQGFALATQRRNNREHPNPQ